MNGLPPAKPIMLKERNSMVFLQYGEIDVKDGAFVLIDKNGIRTHVPVGSLACILLETGTRITHEAVKLAAKVGCLLIWVGDGGVRMYAAGQPGGARADKLLYQAKCALDDSARLNVVRKMYSMRFGETAPAKRSIQQLRGMEGARVRKMYSALAKRYKVTWNSRNYDRNEWGSGDIPNRCLSAGTAALYGIAEAAILAAGYSPAIGFIHSGKPQSFVYDIADIFKFDTVVPVAFKVASYSPQYLEREVRIKCRDMFRSNKLLKRLIPTIEEVYPCSPDKIPQFLRHWSYYERPLLWKYTVPRFLRLKCQQSRVGPGEYRVQRVFCPQFQGPPAGVIDELTAHTDEVVYDFSQPFPQNRMFIR